MTDKSLTATVRDADMRILATLTLNAAHEGFWSGKCACDGKPVFAIIENAEHDFENGVKNGVTFNRPRVTVGEAVHMVDVANEGWRVLVGSSIGAGPVPKPEMVQFLDRHTHDCVEKINEHANRAASRVIESTGVASQIDKLVASACAKINDNANALFSRLIEVRERAQKAVSTLERLGRDNSTMFHESSMAAGKAITEMRELRGRISIAQDDIEELVTTLGIVKAGVDGINNIIGKVVTLKSASDVKMTAARMADDGGVLCVWMHDGVVQSASIPLAALVDCP